MRRPRVELMEPVASAAAIRLTEEASKTCGYAAMARESGAPSLRRSQRPPQRARRAGSLRRTESRRTASPAESPLLVRSWRAWRNGRRSRLRSLTAEAATGGSETGCAEADLVEPGLRAGALAAALDSSSRRGVRPRAASRRRASRRLGASRVALEVAPWRSRAV